MSKRVCLVVCMGIPGAGKTTLTRHLKRKLKLYKTDILNVSYDEVEALLEPILYRNFRRYIYSKVEEMITDLIQYELTTDNLKKWIIFIDDNMYYRSMRRIYYNLAKRFSISYCQVYVSCSTELALSRNESRKEKVPPEIIIKMANQLEPPSAKHLWEKQSIEIDSSKEYTKELIDQIRDFILDAFENPLVSENESEEDMRNENNLMLKCDLMLRKHIGNIFKDAILHNISKENLQELSSNLTQKKKLILREIKKNNLCLPEFDEDSELENLLHKYLTDQ